jgi:hypothetical protein
MRRVEHQFPFVPSDFLHFRERVDEAGIAGNSRAAPDFTR